MIIYRLAKAAEAGEMAELQFCWESSEDFECGVILTATDEFVSYLSYDRNAFFEHVRIALSEDLVRADFKTAYIAMLESERKREGEILGDQCRGYGNTFLSVAQASGAKGSVIDVMPAVGESVTGIVLTADDSGVLLATYFDDGPRDGEVALDWADVRAIDVEGPLLERIAGRLAAQARGS